MVLREAYRILEVTEQDDDKTIKLQFRKKISMYHPDVVGSDRPEHLKKAQQINEAYALLRKHRENRNKNIHKGFNYSSYSSQNDYNDYEDQGGARWYWDTDYYGTDQSFYEEEPPVWKGRVNETAFVERDIYRAPYMDIWQQDECKKIARGRFFWDPDLEEFGMLLKSLNKATMELMEDMERKNRIFYDRDDISIRNQRFRYQTRIFNCLASQFIEPVSCLQKLTEPEKTDKQGRNIYTFKALLGVKGSSAAFNALELLESGDLLYPSSVKNNRLMVHDSNGVELGYLSLDDDQLYYLVIPILQHHKAQVRIMVTETQIKKHTRPYQAKVNVNLYLRMTSDTEEINNSNQNLIIADILNQYEIYLKSL